MIDLVVILAPFIMGIIILIQFIGDVLKQWVEGGD